MIGSASAAGRVVLVSKGVALRDASLRHCMPLYFLPDDTLLRKHSLSLGIPMKQVSSAASCRIVVSLPPRRSRMLRSSRPRG